MNTEHVDVGTDFSDAQLAEIFLHHRVLIVPVIDDGSVIGVITRARLLRRPRAPVPRERLSEVRRVRSAGYQFGYQFERN